MMELKAAARPAKRVRLSTSVGIAEPELPQPRASAQLQHAAGVAQLHEASKDGDNGKVGPQVEERDVISITDAKKSTGYVESIGYSLKRLVWS